MTAPATVRKALPKSNAAMIRAMHNHLAGYGFGEGHRAGITVNALGGAVSVGVMRRQIPDARQMRKLIDALEAFTRVRLVGVSVRNGEMFDTYTFTSEQPAPVAD